MKKYITSKVVITEEMTRREYMKSRSWELPENEQNLADEIVFKVIYKDGYISMCPKDKFLENAIEVGENDFISVEVVEKWLSNCEVETRTLFRKPHTFVHCQLPNKLIISESTTCVDPKNYSEEIGAKICKERIKEKIWFILGAHLSTAKYGINN